jgi:hypothetical protein
MAMARLNHNEPDVLKSLSAKSLVKPEDAAPQIKLIFVVGHPALKGRRNPAMDVFPSFDSLNDSGLAPDAQMFGGIVLGDLQALRQFAHGDRIGEQFADNSPPGPVSQGLQKRFATCGFRRLHTRRLYNAPVGLKTLEIAAAAWAANAPAP